MGGKFVGEAITAAVLKLNPFGKEGYERRARNKAYRKARRKQRRGETLTAEEVQIMAQEVVKMVLPDGSEVPRTEPIWKKRTSTKNLVALFAGPAVGFLATLPFYGEIELFVQHVCESAMNGESSGYVRAAIIAAVTWLVTAAPSYITTRLTKSPAVPGKL